MDYYRQKYYERLIDAETCEKMTEVVFHLEKQNYDFEKAIGEGSFGSVIKIKHKMTEEERAVKIVSMNSASEGELVVWSTLNHDNILPLLRREYLRSADSLLFWTPVHPTSLDQEIMKPSITDGKNSLMQAIVWLKQIAAAVDYLHDISLCHLDLKCDNVLISEKRNAVLTDFGFLTSCEVPVQEYGAPFLYRCPEGRLTDSGFTEVDGKKFDVWSLGTLTFELFTRMTLLEEAQKLRCSSSNWYDLIYPLMQNNLQEDRFTNLMRNAFPTSQKIDQTSGDVISFITSCLVIVPEKRPSIQMLKQHQLLGGILKMEVEPYLDIWSERVNVIEFNSIFQQNSCNLESESCTKLCSDSEWEQNCWLNGEIADIQRNKCSIETRETDDSVFWGEEHCFSQLNDERCSFDWNITPHKNKQCCKASNEQYNFDFKPQPSKSTQVEVLTPANISSFKVSNKVIDHGAIAPEKIPSSSKESICVPVDSSFNVSNKVTTSDHAATEPEKILSSSKESACLPVDISSFKVSNKVITSDHVAIEPEKISSSSKESVSVPDPTPKQCRRQRIRTWWKKRKSSLGRVFAACIPCARISRTNKE